MAYLKILIKYVSYCAVFFLFCTSGCVISQADQPETTPVEPPPEEEPENRAPMIYFIKSEQQEGTPVQFLLYCAASDPDGDTIYYSWYAETGTFKESGEYITWIAPEPTGEYTVSVTARDGRGGEATETAKLTIETGPTNHPPSVTLIISPEDKPEVTITDEIYDPIEVKRWSTTYIECIAEDPDGDALSYEWTSTKGRLIGAGPLVQYVSTDTDYQSISITVMDETGRYTRRTIHFEIPCCGRG
jgi:hypothetical protein